MKEDRIKIDHIKLRNDLGQRLWKDVKDKPTLWEEKPLLAHYTSLEVLEQVLTQEEVWFSNPFYMNDIEELKYGIEKGAQHFRNSTPIMKALGSAERHELFNAAMNKLIRDYDRNSLLDTFIFCLSEHERDNTDGLLSMWRGYGGNGSGAAIVLDAGKSTEIKNSPLVFAKIVYMSDKKRNAWFKQIATIFAAYLSENKVPDDLIICAAEALFDRLKMFALFTKHDGFQEEKEWRLVYMPERDLEGKLRDMISYFNGPNGIEPKLKFKVRPIEGITNNDLCLMKLMHSIVLGPSITAPLSLRAVKSMLKIIQKDDLVDKVYKSSIPYRPSKTL